MIPAILLRHWRLIGMALAALAIVTAVALHFRSDARTRDALTALREETAHMVLAVQAASGNDDVTWKTAPGQVIALGHSNRALKGEIIETNRRIDDMAREAVRLRAKAGEMRIIADKARAQRASALKRLGDMRATPATREDCMTLLHEAEVAIDLATGAMR